MPAHFEQASSAVSVDAVKEQMACGPDPERHVAAIKEYLAARFGEVYVNHRTRSRRLLPVLRTRGVLAPVIAC